MNRLIFLTFVFISTAVKADSWILTNDDTECPDVIEFDESRYIILNDCYGFNPKHPVIEMGVIIKTGNAITFLERNIKQQSFLQHGDKPQTYNVTTNTIDKLYLQKGSVVYKFKKHTLVK